MTKQELMVQITRLEKQFGPFGLERTSLLWDKIQHLNQTWLKGVTDNFIGSCRTMPLLADFQDQITLELEREHHRDKERHKQEAKEFLGPSAFDPSWGTFTQQEGAEMHEMIRAVLKGRADGGLVTQAITRAVEMKEEDRKRRTKT